MNDRPVPCLASEDISLAQEIKLNLKAVQLINDQERHSLWRARSEVQRAITIDTGDPIKSGPRLMLSFNALLMRSTRRVDRVQSSEPKDLRPKCLGG